MGNLLLKIVSVFLFSVALATTTSATPISQAFSFAFRDNEGASPVFTGQGDNFTFGVSQVVPDGNNGTTASARNIATGDIIVPLFNDSASLRPGVFGKDTPIAEAQTKGWLSPWEITMTNGTDSATRITPDRTGAQKMEFAQNLSISGTGASPTATWQLPTTGVPVHRVSYELWNNDTNQIITEQSVLGASAISVSLSGLEIGTNYAIRIIPEQRGADGTVSRSSNWLGWEATNGEAQGTVLELTTGSPVGVSQTVDSPNEAFKVEFDYRFTTTSGFLDVFLNDIYIGARLEAPSIVENEFLHAVFEIEDPSLLNLSGVPLLFQLDGLTGSNILIDNISFPGLLNGDFEQGLELWKEEGHGIISTKDVKAEIIGTWSSGIWYYNLANSEWAKMASSVPSGDIGAGDFTGDGKADVASCWGNGLWYQEATSLDWTKVSNTAPTQLTAGDVTGDGRFEIIGTWSSGIWYYNLANSEWAKMASSVPSGDIAAGDFTGDGKADVASCWGNGLWYQDGDTLDWTKVSNTAPTQLTAGDVTGDGRFEIIGTWSSGIWYYNLANSEWTKMASSVPSGDIAAGDFTGDGKADVASCWGNGLWYQDGDTLDWTKVSNTAPAQLTTGDVTGN